MCSGMGCAGMSDLLGRGTPGWRRTLGLSMFQFEQCRDGRPLEWEVEGTCAGSSSISSYLPLMFKINDCHYF